MPKVYKKQKRSKKQKARRSRSRSRLRQKPIGKFVRTSAPPRIAAFGDSNACNDRSFWVKGGRRGRGGYDNEAGEGDNFSADEDY